MMHERLIGIAWDSFSGQERLPSMPLNEQAGGNNGTQIGNSANS